MELIQESCYVFRTKVESSENPNFDIYIFKDFSGQPREAQSVIESVLNEIRQEIYSPENIFIIDPSNSILNLDISKKRFVGIPIKVLNLADSDDEEKLKQGIEAGLNEIVDKKKIVQYAPPQTAFKKTSGKESKYFIKTALALSDFPLICFVALAVYMKFKELSIEITSLKKIFIDTSGIFSLAQAFAELVNIQSDIPFKPQIINFKSYSSIPKNSGFSKEDFNVTGAFTFISASTSGNLRASYKIDSIKCLTIFYASEKEKKEEEEEKEKCLLHIPLLDKKSVTHRFIPVTGEDFSLSYSESKECIIKKPDIERLDKNKLIDKVLNLNFSYEDDISSRYLENSKHLENIKILYFPLEKFLNDNKIKEFFDKNLNKSLTKIWKNYIIYDDDKLQKVVQSKTLNFIKKQKFLNSKGNWENNNIVVCFAQATNSELIKISRKLREKTVKNITFIVGILWIDTFKEAKILKQNITFKGEGDLYGYHCFMELPSSHIDCEEIDNLKGYHLSDGYVFYKGERSSDLNPVLCYLSMCIALGLLRESDEFSDNISFHDVLSPENFSRYNDPILQLILVMSSKGRELNFESNKKSSAKMKDVIIDIFKQNGSSNISKYIAESIIGEKFVFASADREAIEEFCDGKGWDYFKGDEPPI